MKLLYNFSIFFFILFTCILKGNNSEILPRYKFVNDTINYKSSGEYFPYLKLSKDDSLNIPYTYYI